MTINPGAPDDGGEQPVPPDVDVHLIEALEAVRQSVLGSDFDLATEQQAGRREFRDRLARDIDGHVARLRDIDAPLLVVLGGVTGAGKSTFVNSMLGRELVATGPVRPTTYAPSLVCHPADADAFTSQRILPTLARLEISASDAVPGGASRQASGSPGRQPGVLRLIRSGAVPPGLALLDAPDIDSVSSANRELADQLLDAADLWLWFTTGGKYADEESMRYLRRARARNTALAVVLTQVHRADLDEVSRDFAHKLSAEGLGDVRVFTIPVTVVSAGRLPSAEAGELRGWLHALADAGKRREHRRQTLSGALAALPADIEWLSDAVADDVRVTRSLQADTERAYDSACAEFAKALEEGLPLRGEVVSRWDRFVGSGRFLKMTEAATGQAREWVRGLLANVGIGEERRLEREVRIEVSQTIGGLMQQLADLAAVEAATSWSARPVGRSLVGASDTDLTRRSPGFDERAESVVRQWQERVADNVETIGATRRTQARIVSSIVSVAATSAILLALASAGITGAEAGIAAAAGAANQGLLIKLLGEANLRALVEQARADLSERFEELVFGERQRFVSVLAEAAPDAAQVDALREARDLLVRSWDARG